MPSVGFEPPIPTSDRTRPTINTALPERSASQLCSLYLAIRSTQQLLQQHNEAQGNYHY
jgi:hypothetical protein